MKNLILLVFGIALLGFMNCQPNLTWQGEKDYDPYEGRIFVEGLGINDSVTIVWPDSAFMVEKSLINNGVVSAANYFNQDVVIKMQFVAIAGSAGFIATDDTVFNQVNLGPQLGSGAAENVQFGMIGPLDCGMYKQVLIADSEENLTESNETDNEQEHYFFTPSPQNFGLAKTELLTGIPHLTGVYHTTDWTITTTADTAWITGFSFVATEQSTADTDVMLPIMVPPFSSAVVGMLVEPEEHTIPGTFQPTVTGKLTVISNDGCIIKQNSAKVFVEHEID